MGRRKKGRPISGWLILDKPYDVGATEAVALVRRLFQAQKAGHSGTLDPLATGALPIAMGEATKTVPYVMDGRKVYRFAVRWGHETNTDDLEGEPTERSDHRPSTQDVEAALDGFRGTIEQVPPAYSAIKVDGQRAYDLARAGHDVKLEAREVTIHRLELVDTPDADTIVLEAECSKGTYVRSLARDLARALGTRGHIVELRRTLCGPYNEDALITVEELQEAAANGFEALDQLLAPVETALTDLPEINVHEGDANRVRQGRSILLRGASAPTFADEAYLMSQGDLVALGCVERGQFKPNRVFKV